MTTKLLTLLKQRKFAPLFIAQFCGSFNDNFYKNALIIFVSYGIISITPFSKGIIVNIAAALFVFPMFIFSAIAGQLADKFEKATLIKLFKLWEILIGALAILGLWQKSLAILLLALFILAVQYTFFGPLKYGILPDHLAENELIAGNGLLDASTFISILIGTIAGGLFAEYTHIPLIIGVLILIVATIGWVASLFIPKSEIAAPKLTINKNIFAETLKIVQYARSNDSVFRSILGISWLWTLGFCILTQLPTLTNIILNARADIVTSFLAMFTIGIATGSLLCNKLLHGELDIKYIPIAVFGMSIFLFDFTSACHQLAILTSQRAHLITIGQFFSYFTAWRILIDLFLLAVCGGIYMVPLYVILQTYPAKDHISRVIAANNIFNSIFMVTGVLTVSALLLLHIHLLAILIILAIINLLIGIYIRGINPKAHSKQS